MIYITLCYNKRINYLLKALDKTIKVTNLRMLRKSNAVKVSAVFIVVVPYNDKLIAEKTEHVFSFNENNIPESLDNGFKLVYKKAYTIWDSLSPDDCMFYKKLNYSQFIFVYSKQ